LFIQKLQVRKGRKAQARVGRKNTFSTPFLGFVSSFGCVHTDQRCVGRVNVRGKGVFSSRRNTNTNAQATKGRTKSHFSNGKELNSVTKKKEDPSYLHGLAKELIAAHSKEISVLLPQVVCHLQSHDGP